MNAYTKTFQEFRGNPASMNEAWDETVEQLGRINPTDTSQVLKAHAYLSILDQIVFAAGATNGGR